jgi:hypothetical protein
VRSGFSFQVPFISMICAEAVPAHASTATKAANTMQIPPNTAERRVMASPPVL